MRPSLPSLKFQCIGMIVVFRLKIRACQCLRPVKQFNRYLSIPTVINKSCQFSTDFQSILFLYTDPQKCEEIKTFSVVVIFSSGGFPNLVLFPSLETRPLQSGCYESCRSALTATLQRHC